MESPAMNLEGRMREAESMRNSLYTMGMQWQLVRVEGSEDYERQLTDEFESTYHEYIEACCDLPRELIPKMSRALMAHGSRMLCLAWANKVLMPVTVTEGDDRWAICFDDFEVGSCAEALECGRSYHKRCILKCLMQSGLCPLCRCLCQPPL